jgi:2-C-methyl-D-erythritol 2,4-cyclodiphosphate synthase
MMRIGFGYDIHRIARGKKLRLGGVSFPHAGFGLEGHSDADVLIHALCDALLGAAGESDIGVLFPNSSARHFQRNSLEFLQAVAVRLQKRGFSIINVDCTLVAEAPKISPRVALMKTRLAKALGATAAQIGVKATTNEGLGTIGRGEGMAAFAVALLQQTPKK